MKKVSDLERAIANAKAAGDIDGDTPLYVEIVPGQVLPCRIGFSEINPASVGKVYFVISPYVEGDIHADITH